MKTIIKCPKGHGEMGVIKKQKSTEFRGKKISYATEMYQCPECKLELATIKQAAATQKAIADAYRKNEGLLTGEEIKNFRKKFNLTQQKLAAEMTVGIASIKRWEGGIIQSKSMDKILSSTFWRKNYECSITGNRDLDLARIKLVARQIEANLKRVKLLLKRDKFLFTAKYLWYADMVAYRDIGAGMTGATYAALPYGPQLNNYKDLIDDIMKTDENETEPLSGEEIKIIKKIVIAFPDKQMTYDAAHREIIWRNKTTGDIIPYTDADELTEL